MKKLLLLFLITFLNISYCYSTNNISIQFKVENEIITNIDLKNEEKYLISLNKKLQNLPKFELSKLAKRSLLNEKIKKKTIEDFYDLSKEYQISEQLFINMFKSLGFNSEEEFSGYLKNYDLSTDFLKKKLKIEGLWNKLIYQKFREQVVVDKQKIKKEISILNQKNLNNKEYYIKEILFKLEPYEQLDDKYRLIISNIKNNGFETAANIYSLSESSKYGGNVGWVKKTQLVDKISNEIDKLKKGEISKVIEFNNGYVLIQLSDIREGKNKFDINKEIDKRVNSEIDRQLNELSLIFFNKVKQKIIISEL